MNMRLHLALERAHRLDPKREAWFHAQRLEQVSKVTVKRAAYHNVCHCTCYPWLHHRGVGQCAWAVLKRA